MFIKYSFGIQNLKRIKRTIALSVINGLTRQEAVLRGIKLADKIITRELDKHRRMLIRSIEYLLVKHYLVENRRIEDPMEEFNGTPDNVVDDINNSCIDTLIDSNH